MADEGKVRVGAREEYEETGGSEGGVSGCPAFKGDGLNGMDSPDI